MYMRTRSIYISCRENYVFMYCGGTQAEVFELATICTFAAKLYNYTYMDVIYI